MNSGIHEDAFLLRRADTRTSREEAWSLVHQRYLEKGYAEAGSQPWKATAFDGVEGTVTFFTQLIGRPGPLATFTLVADGPLGLPMDSEWKSALDDLRSQGRRLREATKLATAPASGEGIQHLLPLFRLAFFETQRQCGTDILLVVNPRHRGFYKKALGFTELGEERTLTAVLGAPGIPLRLNLLNAREFYHRTYALMSGPGNLYRYFFENADETKTLEWLARPQEKL